MDSWKRRKGACTVEVIHTRYTHLSCCCLFDTRPNFCCAPPQWLKTLSCFFFLHGIYLLNTVVRIKKHFLDGMKVTCLLFSPIQYFLYSFNHNFLYISLSIASFSLLFRFLSWYIHILRVSNKYFPSF